MRSLRMTLSFVAALTLCLTTLPAGAEDSGADELPEPVAEVTFGEFPETPEPHPDELTEPDAPSAAEPVEPEEAAPDGDLGPLDGLVEQPGALDAVSPPSTPQAPIESRPLAIVAQASVPSPAQPTAYTAGQKLSGAVTNTWGRFDTAVAMDVWTEVEIRPGVWSRSQQRRTDATGYFVIPLTYGATTPGTYRYRVAGRYGTGETARSSVFTLQRVAVTANPVISATTHADVARHWTAGCPMHYNRLSTLRINYVDFDGNIQRGEIIVRSDLAGQVSAVFTETFNARFPIYQMRNPNVWNGSDPAMMADNNTSGFNCRKVVGNPYAWSPHAYGIAVDINPVQNPYRDPSGRWWPSTQHVTRAAGVKGMLYSNSAPVRAFQSRGWEWFSGWDWHHFQKR